METNTQAQDFLIYFMDNEKGAAMRDAINKQEKEKEAQDEYTGLVAG